MRRHTLAMTATILGLAAVTTVSAQTINAPPPSEPVLHLAFEETVTLADAMTPGATSMGQRNIVPITGGTFEGPGDGTGIKGTIIPGGWDWQLVRADGCIWIKADYMLKTDDGAIINVVNQGPLCPPTDGKPFKPARTSPVFEPPVGKYAWLGQSAFIGTLDPTTVDGKPAVHIRFYRAD